MWCPVMATYSRICTAHSKRDGLPCHAPAMKGKSVCRHHGGKAGRPRGTGVAAGARGPGRAGNEASRAALTRRRADKAAGVPVVRMGRIPGRRKGEPIEISRARVAVDDQLARLENDDASEFAVIKKDALRVAKLVLRLPNDLESFQGTPVQQEVMQHKRLTLQAHMAESVLADAIKIDEAGLRHVEHTDKIDILMQKLRSIKMPTE
jgi:hypothetical protein